MTKIHVLGTAQDGGIPHLGCQCFNCQQASDYPIKQRRVASIGIAGEEGVLLVDATPDIVQQSSMLRQHYPDHKLGFDSILLTHLHTGHYMGLVMLGREAASTSHMPLYLTSPLLSYLSSNKPFSYLFDRKQVEPQEMVPGRSFRPDPAFSITPLSVPHRNEDGDTVGLVITSQESQAKLLYISDIDFLDNSILEVVKGSDVVLFDGTFYSSNEIPQQERVPHPPIQETIQAVGRTRPGNFYFTHFNHTNPVIGYGSEYEAIQERGFEIAEDGLVLEL